jgi:co-chaperonin GroES (HSP10)|tara:strand:+ start:1011 stop:1268 length:258 start_codon:yes stop_codon:yes gene_type:complete
MKPISKYIIIKTVEEEVKTSSGLLLSAEDANNMRYKRGLVIMQGTDVTVIKEGDEIYYDKRAGFTMLIENEPYTIITENDVIVVL